MKTSDIPELIAFRPNEDDKERVVRIARNRAKITRRKFNMSEIIRRGLELVEKESEQWASK